MVIFQYNASMIIHVVVMVKVTIFRSNDSNINNNIYIMSYKALLNIYSEHNDDYHSESKYSVQRKTREKPKSKRKSLIIIIIIIINMK